MKYHPSVVLSSSISIWTVNKKKPVSTVKKAHGSHGNTGLEQPYWVSSVAALHNSDTVASGASGAHTHTLSQATNPVHLNLQPPTNSHLLFCLTHTHTWLPLSTNITIIIYPRSTFTLSTKHSAFCISMRDCSPNTWLSSTSLFSLPRLP